jgi:hypothetical protein
MKKVMAFITHWIYRLRILDRNDPPETESYTPVMCDADPSEDQMVGYDGRWIVRVSGFPSKERWSNIGPGYRICSRGHLHEGDSVVGRRISLPKSLDESLSFVFLNFRGFEHGPFPAKNNHIIMVDPNWEMWYVDASLMEHDPDKIHLGSHQM